MHMKKAVILFLAGITTVIYFIWRIGYSLPLGGRPLDLFFALLLLGCELLGLIVACYDLYLHRIRRPFTSGHITSNNYPDIDILVLAKGKSPEMILKTLNGCLHMDYPDPNKLHIYLCDNRGLSELSELAHHMSISYIALSAEAENTSYNTLLQQTTSPYVAFFDGDVIPMHDFLTTTIPYFLKNSEGREVGFVQTPLSYYSEDLFKFNLFSDPTHANEQHFFSHFIEQNRNAHNAVILLKSSAIISRKALEQIHGFKDSPLATGMCIQAEGYTSYALDTVHANGASPANIEDFFAQKKTHTAKWCHTLLHTQREVKKKLTLAQRIAYKSLCLYEFAPIGHLLFLLAPLMAVLLGIQLFRCSYFALLTIVLPHFLFYGLVLYRLSGEYFSLLRRPILNTILAFPLLPVLIKSPFKNTQTSYKPSRSLRTICVYIFTFGLSLIACVICLMHVLYSPINAILLLWSLINSYNLIMALFFVMGRKSKRAAERIPIRLPIQLIGEGWQQNAYTHDLSEGGLSFEFDTPKYIPESDLFQIILSDEEGRYKAQLKGEIVHVREVDDKWLYSATFKEVEDAQRLQLYQILYDRVPQLTAQRKAFSCPYAIIKKNILMRRTENKPSRRKLPRVKLNRKFYALDGSPVYVQEFNYEYILVTSKKNLYSDHIELRESANHNIVFNCSLVKKIYDQNNKKVAFALYRLNNAKDYMSNDSFQKTLSKWAVEARKDFDKQIKLQRQRSKEKEHISE